MVIGQKSITFNKRFEKMIRIPKIGKKISPLWNRMEKIPNFHESKSQ
jgi:hypothetical protein